MCAAILDDKRLGKQRVECLQILRALRGETKGWRNHPATLMWSGYERALQLYMDCMITEWAWVRGFKNSIPLNHGVVHQSEVPMPDWWSGPTIEAVVNSHRSNLLRKDPDYYSQFSWEVERDLPYVWPVTKDDLLLKKVLDHCP